MSQPGLRDRLRPGTAVAVVPRPRRGSALGLTVLGLVVIVAVVLSLMIGSTYVSPSAVVESLLHPGTVDVVTELRLPRTVLAVMAGAALGVAGALMQGHTRNPLADPGLLGVQAGATIAVIGAIALLGVNSLAGYVWFALTGAGIASVAVFAIGSTRRGPDPVSLVLAGTAVQALLFALARVVLLSDTQVLNDYRFWAVGSVSARGLDVVIQVLPFILLGLVLAALNAGRLSILQLGDDVARSLGLRPARHKLIGIAAVMLLTGAATAACGPIAFLGLVVPHVARWLCGPDFRWVLAYSALLGAALITLADVVGRVVAPPGEVQVGIVMAVIGAPVFIVIVRRMRKIVL